MIGKILKRETFNDTLALVLVVGILGLWVLDHWKPISDLVLGATIPLATKVVDFYFRKAKPGGV